MSTNRTIRAKKSLGQNFLIDQEALYDIAHALPITGKNIIEVGPGYGALTEHLLSQEPQTLTLVELDQDMITLLSETFSFSFDEQEKKYISQKFPQILSLSHQDILTFTPQKVPYSVIANIPYYITSPILFHFLYSTSFTTPESMVIMMQQEVGEKILAGRKKKRHHSFLSLAIEEACRDIDIVRYVPREAFDPAPKVDSIVLRFLIRSDRDIEQEEQLLDLWKIAFTHPRKTLISNLKGSRYFRDDFGAFLRELGYDEKIRAEAILREDWKQFL